MPWSEMKGSMSQSAVRGREREQAEEERDREEAEEEEREQCLEYSSKKVRWRGMRVGDRCRQRSPQLTDSLLSLVMRRLIADALHDDLDVSAHRVGLSDDSLHLIDETAESRPSLFVFHLQTSTRSDC
jgi:hypothetical protein